MAADVPFRQGVLAGIAASAALVQVWLAVELPTMRAMYRDLGGELALATRVVLHPAWLWGVPAVAAVKLGWLVVQRPRALVLYVVLVIALAATIAATWYFAHAPMYELAGNIRSE